MSRNSLIPQAADQGLAPWCELRMTTERSIGSCCAARFTNRYSCPAYPHPEITMCQKAKMLISLSPANVLAHAGSRNTPHQRNGQRLETFAAPSRPRRCATTGRQDRDSGENHTMQKKRMRSSHSNVAVLCAFCSSVTQLCDPFGN